MKTPTKQRENRPLASRPQVAEFLGIPVGTLDQWAHKGVGPRYALVGRHARYRWSDVEQWLDDQEARGGVDR